MTRSLLLATTTAITLAFLGSVSAQAQQVGRTIRTVGL